MSRPDLETFNPELIKWHDHFMHIFYSQILPRSLKHGTQQILLSGAVGSAKSLVMEHVICRYAVENSNAHIGVGRLAMPDLKSTLYKNIGEHIPSKLMKKEPAKVAPKIELINNSVITGKSWSDYNLAKLGSYEYTAFAIEELTESDIADAYNVILQRIRKNGKNGEIVPKFLISATNPNSPTHWAYTNIIEKAGWVNGEKVKAKNVDDNIWVFYSVTLDNPFLDSNYKNTLERNLSPKEAERMVYGKWIDIAGQGVYYSYDEEKHYIKKDYEIDLDYPIHIGFDFNTASGKPMSAICAQYINDKFHFFKEYVVHNANTFTLMEEICNSGIFDLDTNFIINGDAAGWSKMSSATDNDYAIIEQYISHYKKYNENGVLVPVNYDIEVPVQNPAVKARHNLVNRYMMNLKKEVRVYVYHSCKMLNKGFKGTVLKKGSSYVEDDGPKYPFQHVTTAAGYLMYFCTLENTEIKQVTW